MISNEALDAFSPASLERAIYVQMSSEAAWADGWRKAQGVMVSVKKGQLVFGRRAWADKFETTEGIIRGVMKRLETVQLVSQMMVGKNCVVTVTYLAEEPGANREITGGSPASDPITKTLNSKRKDKDTDKDFVAAAPKKVVPDLDWSPLNLTPEHQEAVKAIRKKHGKKGVISQRVINTLGKEFAKARAAGLSDEDIINKWDTRGWLAFEADWLIRDFVRTGQQGMPARGLPFNRDLAREEHNKQLATGGNW